jgi:hypothetical protein
LICYYKNTFCIFYLQFIISIIIIIIDAVDTVNLNNNPDTLVARPENTDIEFTCLADANPPVNVGLYVGDIKLIEEQKTEVTLKTRLIKEYNGVGFICKTPSKLSTMKTYNVLCKYMCILFSAN